MNLSHALRLESRAVVSFVGGGGKSSAMMRLAGELAAQGRRVLVTTTTRIFAAQMQPFFTSVSFEVETHALPDLIAALHAAFEQHPQVLLVGRIGGEKATGVPPTVIDALASHFDVILVEADGARMLPFKAPADHEPVIPASTTIVVSVVGIDAVGQPLNEDTVHRPERISQLSGTPLESPITAETVAAVLRHPQGGLRGVPDSARVVSLLNKVDSETRLHALRIAARVRDSVDMVLIGAVQESNPVRLVDGHTAAIILAAGGSSRFGAPKQLAPWKGQTFLERAVAVALDSRVDAVVVVLGAETARCQELLAPYPVTTVINPRWQEGQSTSMQAGLAALPANMQAAVFMLVDLPAVEPHIVDRLLAAHRVTLAPIVYPEYQGKRGNPVLFDRALFAELNQISGDTGGRPLFKKYAAQAERIPVETPAILHDVDRPEDLAAYFQERD